MIQIFSAQAADADTAIAFTTSEHRKATLGAEGTWGGGSMSMQGLFTTGGAYIDLHTPLTADGAVTFDLPPGLLGLRCSLTGSTTPSLNAALAVD